MDTRATSALFFGGSGLKAPRPRARAFYRRYAEALLDTPLPWTRMRQVYRLLGLVKKWGPSRVELACRRALEAEAIDVNLVSRMLERAREDLGHEASPAHPVVIQGRFSRDPSEFATTKEAGR